MSNRQRHALMILAVVLISLTLLAAPARGDDWFGVHMGSNGFGLSFGSTDWAVWGASWSNPSWSIDYHVALSGYGEWVWVDGLGQCWMPWVTPNWRPFNHGRWVWTSFGWTWVAYEPWGYFPHHFGHWAMAPMGWVWAPGTSYHAANVVWVSGDAWIGWYPSPPPGWSHHYHHGHHDGWGTGWNDARYATFVGWGDLGSDDLSEHALGAEAVRARTPRAVLRDGAAAPTRHELGRRGVTIPEMSLERRTARVAGRDVMLARPREAAATIERNAGRTVERALAPEARGTLARNATGGRQAAATHLPTRGPTATSRDRSTVQDSRPAAARSGRVEPPGRSSRAPEPAVTAAPSRTATGRPEARTGGLSTRSAPAARAPSRAGSPAGAERATAPRVDTTRASRSTVPPTVATPRSPAAAARSTPATRQAVRDRREPARQARPTQEESRDPSETRSRRSDQKPDDKKTASRPAARSRS